MVVSWRRQALYDTISELQIKCEESPSADLVKELLIKNSGFDYMATDEAVQLITRTKHSYYEFGDKPANVLAHCIRQSSTGQCISEVSGIDGFSADSQRINDRFRDFYSSLYTSDNLPGDAHFDDFFNGLMIPTVAPDIAVHLDKPFTAGEIKTAIMSMQSGRCPGPNGFPSEFYKAFIDKLSPLMLAIFKEASESGILPLTLRQATISLIPKKR
uniref:Reverse transcriptase domain-containing protein n=1 Tax=Nothobranchius kuhntae TaxID=321403 RepID=A0A1A8HXD3_NOTKU